MSIKKQILIFLSVLALLVWMFIFKHSQSNILKVVFFNVDQGDSIFIETPNKRQILIDGGPDNVVLEKLGAVMPFYDRYIDLIILTHPDEDHLTGLIEVLNQFQVGGVLVSGAKKDDEIYRAWERVLSDKNISTYLARAGQTIILDNDVFLKILWPDKTYRNLFINDFNNASVVAQLNYHNAEFLLTGDIGKKVENILINQNISFSSDVFKIAHHGSKNSTSQLFLQSINPKVAVISVGANTYGHPHQSVLELLKNVLIYRTDINGDIKMTTDGYVIETNN